METIDLKTEHKELYRAKRTPEEVAVPAGTFLVVEGVGEPGGEAYQAAIASLYGVAYTMKFALKAAGVLDFKIPNLECLWLFDPNSTPPTEWEWRLSIRVPDRITAAHVAEAIRQVEAKKGTNASLVRRTDREGGRAIQILHVGPYGTVTDSYEKLRAYAQERGLEVEGTGVEVYLSDPRRTLPEKLRTIVRMPLASAR